MNSVNPAKAQVEGTEMIRNSNFKENSNYSSSQEAPIYTGESGQKM